MHARFPLPEGHSYGTGADPRRHDGREVVEGIHLRQAQRALRERWRQSLHISGRYDGATERAIVHVQRLHNLHPTGLLDDYVWELVFTSVPPK